MSKKDKSKQEVVMTATDLSEPDLDPQPELMVETYQVKDPQAFYVAPETDELIMVNLADQVEDLTRQLKNSEKYNARLIAEAEQMRDVIGDQSRELDDCREQIDELEAEVIKVKTQLLTYIDWVFTTAKVMTILNDEDTV